MMTTTDHGCPNSIHGDSVGSQGGGPGTSVERSADGGGGNILTNKIYHQMGSNRSTAIGSLDTMIEHGGKLDPKTMTQSYMKSGFSHPPKEHQEDCFPDIGNKYSTSNKFERKDIDNNADSNFLQEMKFKVKRKQDRGAAAAAALAESSDSFPDVTEQLKDDEERVDQNYQYLGYNDKDFGSSKSRSRRVTGSEHSESLDQEFAQEPDSPAVTTSTTATMTTNLTEEPLTLSDAPNERMQRERDRERSNVDAYDCMQRNNNKKHQQQEESRYTRTHGGDQVHQNLQERGRQDALPKAVSAKNRNTVCNNSSAKDNNVMHRRGADDGGMQRSQERQQKHVHQSASRTHGFAADPAPIHEHGHSRPLTPNKQSKENHHRHRHGDGGGRNDTGFRDMTVPSSVSAALGNKEEKIQHGNSRQTTRPSSGVTGTNGASSNSKGLVIVVGKPHQRRQTNEKDEAEMDMTHHYHRSVDGLEMDDSINNHRAGRGRERRLFDDPLPQMQQQRLTQTAGDERYDSRGRPSSSYTVGKASRDFYSKTTSQGSDIKKKKDYVAIAEEQFKNRRRKSGSEGDGNQNHRDKIATPSRDHSIDMDYNAAHQQSSGHVHLPSRPNDYTVAERKREHVDSYPSTSKSTEQELHRKETLKDHRQHHYHRHEHGQKHYEVTDRVREAEGTGSSYFKDRATSDDRYAPQPEMKKSFDISDGRGGQAIKKTSDEEGSHLLTNHALKSHVDPRQPNEAESLSEPPPLEEFEAQFGRPSNGTRTFIGSSRPTVENFGPETSTDYFHATTKEAEPLQRHTFSHVQAADRLLATHNEPKGSTQSTLDAKPSALPAPIKAPTPNVSTSHNFFGGSGSAHNRQTYDESQEPAKFPRNHPSDLKGSHSRLSFPRESTATAASVTVSNTQNSSDLRGHGEPTTDPTLGYAHAARGEDNRSSKGSVVSFCPSTLDISGTSAAWRLEEMKATLKETLDENEDLLKDLQQMISTCEMLEKDRSDAMEENAGLKENEFNLQKQIHDLQVRLSEQQEVSSQAQSIAAASMDDNKSNELLNKLVKDNRQLLQERSKLMMELNEKLREDLAHKEMFSKAQAEWEVEHQALRETVARQQEEIFALKEKLALQKQKKKEKKEGRSKVEEGKGDGKRSSGASHASVLSHESGLSRKSQKSSKSSKSSKSHRRSSRDKRNRQSSKESGQQMSENTINEGAKEDDNGSDENLKEPKPFPPASSLARAVAEQVAGNSGSEVDSPLNESSHSRKSLGDSTTGSISKRRSKGRIERNNSSNRTLDSIQEEESKVEIEASDDEGEREALNSEFVEEKASGGSSADRKAGSLSASQTRKSHRKDRGKDRERRSKEGDSTALVEQMEALDQKQKETKDRRKAEVLRRQRDGGSTEHLSASNHTNTTTDTTPSMVIHLREDSSKLERNNTVYHSTSKSVSSSGGRSKSSVLTKKRNNYSHGIAVTLGGSNSGSRRLTDIQSSIHSIGSGISAKLQAIGRHSHHDTPSNISTELPPHIQKLLQKRPDHPLSQSHSSGPSSVGDGIEKSTSARDVLENTAHGGETVIARRKDLKKLLSTPNLEP